MNPKIINIADDIARQDKTLSPPCSVVCGAGMAILISIALWIVVIYTAILIRRIW